MTVQNQHRRPIWETLTEAERAFVKREAAKARPLEECDPAHVTRLAVALGLRPGHLPANATSGGDAGD